MIHFKYSGYDILVSSLMSEMSANPLYTYKIENNIEETISSTIYDSPLLASEAAETHINKIQLSESDYRRVV